MAASSISHAQIQNAKIYPIYSVCDSTPSFILKDFRNPNAECHQLVVILLKVHILHSPTPWLVLGDECPCSLMPS